MPVEAGDAGMYSLRASMRVPRGLVAPRPLSPMQVAAEHALLPRRRWQRPCDNAPVYARMQIRKMPRPVLIVAPCYRENIESFIRIYTT